MSFLCSDIDECFTGDLVCGQECINTDGGAHCLCSKGYNLAEDNATCTGNTNASSLKANLVPPMPFKDPLSYISTNF